MYEYMRGLQRQFFKEPDFPELRQEINEIHQALTEGKETSQRRGQHPQTKGWPLGGTLAQYLQAGSIFSMSLQGQNRIQRTSLNGKNRLMLSCATEQ